MRRIVMLRIMMIMVIVSLVAGTAAAQMGGRGPRGMHGGPYRAEAEAILDRYENRVPSELTFGEMEELAGELSIPAQKAAFVGFSRISSMIMPGAGQFINRDFVSGALFGLGDLTIKAGTLVGIYFLLPPEVQFDQLDYYTAPRSQIKDTWETALNGMSLQDTLPILGVAAGGMLLDGLLGHFSGAHAARLARERIASGEKVFEPRPELVMMAGGRFGMGMRLGF